MKKNYVLLLLILTVGKGLAQTATVAPVPVEKEWDVSLNGFIRTDYIWDTRKSVQVREDNLNLYPLDEALDVNGDDINKAAQSNFLSVTSRLGVKAKGPNVWGAKTTGVLEGDFFGNFEGSTIGLFRLRHGYVNLEWSKTLLTMGQTWYPQFIPEVFPGVANFNTGIMFNPFGWATQVKVKQMLTKDFSFTAVAYKEREFTTQTAATGSQNSASLNSVLPTLHGQFQYKNKNVILGVGGEFKSLQPLTSNGSTTNLLASNEKVNSTSFFGYAKYSNEKISIKAYGITGGNLANFVMLGGFTGKTEAGKVETYDPIKTTAFWVDIASNGKSIAPGVFFGYTKNSGSSDDNSVATFTNYSRGVSGSRVVDKVWRASGRVDFKQNKFRISPEIEYTVATWGDLVKSNGTADTNKKDLGNFRTMISCSYSF
jgi:hypothetical protein